jgi:uncharacterized RDD family membrane protein YckC
VADHLVTPEAVALDLEPATVGSRSVAILLDYLLIGSGLVLLAAAEAAFGFGGFVPNWLGIALLLLLVFALQFGYPTGFETLWRGRTPGKAAMGLRVVTVEGAPVRFRHAAVRAAVGLVELQATLGGIAVIASFASPRGQRLGDLAAGTLVVRERRSGGAPQAVRFDAPRGLESYVRILDVSRVDATDYATVRDLLRRPMDPATREAVAREVAASLVGRVQPPPPAGVDAVRWLQAVAAAVQARRGGLGTVGPTQASAPSSPVGPEQGGGQAAGSGHGGGGADGPPPPPRPSPASGTSGPESTSPEHDSGFRPPG